MDEGNLGCTDAFVCVSSFLTPPAGLVAALASAAPVSCFHHSGLFQPSRTSLKTTCTKGISDHQKDEPAAEMALLWKVSLRSSGSGRSLVASVPIFCLPGSSGWKGSGLCAVNTIRRASLSDPCCIALLGTKCSGLDEIPT